MLCDFALSELTLTLTLSSDIESMCWWCRRQHSRHIQSIFSGWPIVRQSSGRQAPLTTSRRRQVQSRRSLVTAAAAVQVLLQVLVVVVVVVVWLTVERWHCRRRRLIRGFTRSRFSCGSNTSSDIVSPLCSTLGRICSRDSVPFRWTHCKHCTTLCSVQTLCSVWTLCCVYAMPNLCCLLCGGW